jgi:hypothetical protein
MQTLLLIGWFLIGPIAPVIIYRKWPILIRTIRFIALFTTLYLIGISFFLWLDIGDNNLLLFGIVLALVGGLIILSWPLISPNLVKKYGLKW